ncbi:GGDEF domain-containing protein [Massilia glaciei]|uniref:diguanylate cyclase n=1 Tax=Massilia glaciei TaxID=1524097 RepID=A0A2U2HH18_9BURK|nr:diguanylate cyclase [Massilia glaciei]PWF44748.1 sensor domain-containing diguanylate cyclase [Massilia glaciei]
MIDAQPPIIVARLVEESPEAVCIIDALGTVRYLNPAMQALAGYPLGELVGRPLYGLLADPAACGAKDYILQMVNGVRQDPLLGKMRECALRHRDGAELPVELRVRELGASGGVGYLGAFVTDLRARHALEARNAALLEQIEQLAMSDPLTGLPNRRAFEAQAAHVAARARRSGAPVAVAIADIDHFKEVNDRYGHVVGDAVLAAVAKAVIGASRTTDVVARVGGEEFGLMLPDTDAERARFVAERIRQRVSALAISTPNGDRIQVTVSIGLAPLVQEGFEVALTRADAALYLAKRGGRNRVEQA